MYLVGVESRLFGAKHVPYCCTNILIFKGYTIINPSISGPSRPWMKSINKNDSKPKKNMTHKREKRRKKIKGLRLLLSI